MVDGRDPQAEWYPSPNFWSGRNGQTLAYIVNHGTAGGGAENWFRDPRNTDSSATYVIKVDGHIYQCVDENDTAWANGAVTQGADSWWQDGINPNYKVISIEWEKLDENNNSAITSEQETAGFALMDRICTRWNIPRRLADASGGITGHYRIDPVYRSQCPGPYPWDQMFAALNGGTTMSGIPAGWHDDGTTLTASNGIPVVQGFRLYILENSWDPENLPLEAEHGQSPLENSNPSLGDGTQQIFRWKVLEWQKSTNKVFEAWTGQELLWYHQHSSGVTVHPDVLDDIRILYGNAQKLKADAGL